MSGDDQKTPTTLSDRDIRTEYKTGRRNFLGLMAVAVGGGGTDAPGSGRGAPCC